MRFSDMLADIRTAIKAKDGTERLPDLLAPAPDKTYPGAESEKYGRHADMLRAYDTPYISPLSLLTPDTSPRRFVRSTERFNVGVEYTLSVFGWDKV